MFKFFSSKKRQIDILSPVTGTAIPIEEVKDEVFSKKMVGDGVAIIPDNDVAVVPVDGTVSLVMETGHAFGITTANGVLVLVHIGIDTVKENGTGFHTFLHENQKVKAGMKAVAFNRKYLMDNGYNLSTMVLLPELTDSSGQLQKEKGEVVAGESIVLKLSS